MTALLRLEGISKRYGEVTALEAVSGDIPGGAIGLLGPNGAGKSTLLKVLLGLVTPTEGQGEVLGLELGARSGAAIRARIGYMPESDVTFPGLTGHEMVVYGARLSGLPYAEADRQAHLLLDQVRMGEERYRAVTTLSTGMRQKVRLAQALVHGPELVFLDEPTNGLDPRGREEMLTIVAAIAAAGIHVVLSTHLLRDVERVCETVVLLDRGRLLHVGPLADFTGSDEERYEVRVRDGADRFEAALSGAGCEVVSREDGSLLVALPPGSDLELFWRTALAAEVQVRHLRLNERTLQDAFVGFIEDRRAEGA